MSLFTFLFPAFPTLHSSALVKREIIANYSLLYEIEGADKSLKPYMLCAHMDVVPVERDKWNFDPFGGNVDGGFIYGRGAVDVKDALMVSDERRLELNFPSLFVLFRLHLTILLRALPSSSHK